jgi:MFS family permease
MIIEMVTPAAIALSTSPFLVGAELAFLGCDAVVWGVLLSSLRQELTPARLQGRVTSAYRLLEHGGAAPGALVGGLIAAGFGLTAPFWLGALTGALLIPLVWSTFSEAPVAAARREAHSPRSEPRA